MNLFTPVPTSYVTHIPRDDGTTVRLTRWPLQLICARIEPADQSEERIEECTWG